MRLAASGNCAFEARVANFKSQKRANRLHVYRCSCIGDFPKGQFRSIKTKVCASRAFEKLDIDIVQGDILDASFLKKQMQGCYAVFHAAAIIGLENINKN